MRILCAAFMLILASDSFAHQGPDPVAHWTFTSRTVSDNVCDARLGPDLQISPEARIESDSLGQYLDLTSKRAPVAMSEVIADRTSLPRKDLTISAWVAIHEAEEKGVIAGAFGASESGEHDEPAPVVLGYNGHAFTLRMQTAEGGATLLESTAGYEKGKWTHVAAVYDGQTAQLFVNGKLDAESHDANGEIVYPEQTRVALAGDAAGKLRPLRGKLREVSVYNMAARPKWVAHEFEHGQQVIKLTDPGRSDALSIVVAPYLQYGTQEGMTIMWQTSREGSSIVHYGETAACELRAESQQSLIHEVRIEGLSPETQYFYRVETVDEAGQTVSSGVSTFSTAVKRETPFAFVVISDTQMNPVVSAKLARLAWAQRPSFLLHAGDLVDTGVNDSHWTQHFFPGMQELISRVPMYSVLGNHEQNARNYFDYMSLPEPEYYYDFRYGVAHFFMVDSNRDIGPGSEQYDWLDASLAKSDATWKFVCHHHPPYSSDENDYGDLWKTNKSERGDLRARQLSTLYDKHQVDIVWNGHIHSYERTWPVREGRAVSSGEGPIYMITGGGGGSLETPGLYRPFFQNRVQRGHHYVMVHINAGELEMRSYDLDDRLFDTMTIEKQAD